MESIKQHANALLLISLLVLAKFVLVPVYQWQQSTIASNTLLEKRLIKSAYAIANKDQMQQVLSLSNKQLTQRTKTIFNYQPSNQFKLSQQKQLDKIFEQHEVEIVSVIWQAVVPLNQWKLNQYQVKLRIKGTVTGMQKIQADLESQSQWLSTENFNFRIDRRRKNHLGKLSGRIALNYFVKMPNSNTNDQNKN